jgi:hypothetical protein
MPRLFLFVSRQFEKQRSHGSVSNEKPHSRRLVAGCIYLEFRPIVVRLKEYDPVEKWSADLVLDIREESAV